MRKKVCVIFLIHNVNANICLIFLFLPQTEHSCRSSPECSSPGCSTSSAQVSAYNSPWCRRRHPHSGHNEPGPGVCIHGFAPCYSTREQTLKKTLRICAHLSHREERDNLKRKAPFPPVRERSPARRDVPPSPHSRSGSSISSRSYSPERGKVHPFPPQQGKSMKNLQSKWLFNHYLVFLWFWFIYTTVQNYGVRMDVYILIIHTCIIMHDGVYDLKISTSTQHCLKPVVFAGIDSLPNLSAFHLEKSHWRDLPHTQTLDGTKGQCTAWSVVFYLTWTIWNM